MSRILAPRPAAKQRKSEELFSPSLLLRSIRFLVVIPEGNLLLLLSVFQPPNEAVIMTAVTEEPTLSAVEGTYFSIRHGSP
jgi:hypothetical protein